MAVFLIPSLKLKQKVKKSKTVENIIHQFLMKNFQGYTVEAGNIFGYFKNKNQEEEEYGEHRRFTVAFKGEEKIPLLEKFLAYIGKMIREESIYFEIGKNAWLVYSKQI